MALESAIRAEPLPCLLSMVKHRGFSLHPMQLKF